MASAMMFNAMPELPEVETLRRELNRVLVNQTIKSGKILWPGSVKPLSLKQFLKKIIGQKIVRVERRAKILFLNFTGGGALAIHLKMTGQLVYRPSTSYLLQANKLIVGGHPEDPTKHTRAIFNFTDDSRLYFNDLRKFGWLKILPAGEVRQIHEQHGLEPLSANFTLKNFTAALKRYPNRRLKQTLLDQTLIAGLGNIYADESCFAAGLRPARRIKTLTSDEIKKLHQAIKNILRRAIKKGGTSARNYVRSDGSRGGFFPLLKVYGHGGRPCRRCQTPIAKIKLAGRGTHFCSKCQR